MRPPEFWSRQGSLSAALLTPLGDLYGFLVRKRLERGTPYRPTARVICIGNVTMGGTGKTPVAKAVGTWLANTGKRVSFLSRGYGGSLKIPTLVDPARHTPREVGDEPLELSTCLPAIVSPDRAAGARLAETLGTEIIVMDDGFQNPSVAKDFSLLVFDGGAGLGNGKVFPAGPLREPFSEAVARADAAVIVGEDRHNLASRFPAGFPVLRGTLRLEPSDIEPLRGKKVVAFAGIGRPEKFFESLKNAGLNLIKGLPFPDHHLYTEKELNGLRTYASTTGARLVTTAKDATKLSAARQEFSVVHVSFVPETPEFWEILHA